MQPTMFHAQYVHCVFNENLFLMGFSASWSPPVTFSLSGRYGRCARLYVANHSTKFWAAPERRWRLTEKKVQIMHVLYASAWRTFWPHRSCWAASALSPCGRALSSWCLWPRSPGPSPAYSAACYPEDKHTIIGQLRILYTHLTSVEAFRWNVLFCFYSEHTSQLLHGQTKWLPLWCECTAIYHCHSS